MPTLLLGSQEETGTKDSCARNVHAPGYEWSIPKGHD